MGVSFTMFEYDFSRLDVAEVNIKDRWEDENEIVAGFVVISRRKRRILDVKRANQLRGSRRMQRALVSERRHEFSVRKQVQPGKNRKGFNGGGGK